MAEDKKVEEDKQVKNDIFDLPDKLIKIWENERATRNFNTTLIWENIKFFVGLLGALLGAHMLLLGFLWSIKEKGMTILFGVNFNWFVIALLVFPVAIGLLSLFGWRDLRTRWQRFLLVVTHLLKLEDLLGLHEDISLKLHYLKDNYLFPDYRANFKRYKSYEELRQGEMNKPNTYTSMKNVYLLMCAFSGVLVFLDVYLARLVLVLRIFILAAIISPSLFIAVISFHFKCSQEETRIPDEIITRTIGLIRLSGYSNNLLISSLVGGLSSECRLPFLIPFEMSFQLTRSPFISQKSLTGL